MTPARQTAVFRKTKIRMGKFVSRHKNQQIKGVASSQTVLKCTCEVREKGLPKTTTPPKQIFPTCHVSHVFPAAP